MSEFIATYRFLKCPLETLSGFFGRPYNAPFWQQLPTVNLILLLRPPLRNLPARRDSTSKRECNIHKKFQFRCKGADIHVRRSDTVPIVSSTTTKYPYTAEFRPSIRVLTGLTIAGCASMLWPARNEGCFLSASTSTRQAGLAAICPKRRLDF